MPVLDLDGRPLSWREAGRGAPALLFHCSLAHSGALAGLMAGLGDRLAMRAPDLPGHGRSAHMPPGTDYTFGFDTAVSIATESIDRLRTTTEAHHRCMVVEVMGRHVGWIALHAGLASGAHARSKSTREALCTTRIRSSSTSMPTP